MSVKKGVTRQESEIAELITRGYCNKEIARELKIAEATVKSHCNRLFRKYNVSGRLQLGLKLKGFHPGNLPRMPNDTN
jgi:DNA-binding NarL/FixJ family response regulator